MARLLVLLGALCGLAACVLPLYRQSQERIALNVSVLNLWQGPQAWREQLGTATVPTDRASDEVLNKKLSEAKVLFTALVAGPALLLLLLLLLGMRRFGRGLGVLALLVGLAGVGAWALMSAAIDKAGEGHPDWTLEKGTALMLMLAAGALGALGGLAALIKPSPRV